VGGRGGAGGRGGGIQITPGRVVGRNITAKQIILTAYSLKDYQLSGGPAWLDSDRFDLEAKTDAASDENQLNRMLRGVLSSRFKLTAHHATKDIGVYRLVVGKNGLKLPEVKQGQPGPKQPPGSMVFMIETMQQFVDELNVNGGIDRPVLNETGLTGVYAFDLQPGEDFRIMLEDRAGLKFESQKAPTDILVIDHMEKPDGN
jgi:uncharacterized protein (TIGR03435 family)